MLNNYSITFADSTRISLEPSDTQPSFVVVSLISFHFDCLIVERYLGLSSIEHTDSERYELRCLVTTTVTAQWVFVVTATEALPMGITKWIMHQGSLGTDIRLPGTV